MVQGPNFAVQPLDEKSTFTESSKDKEAKQSNKLTEAATVKQKEQG